MPMPRNPHAQARMVHPHPEQVRVLGVSPCSIHIEHQLYLDAGAVCRLELPADTGVMRRAGRVLQCTSLLGRDLPFWYESEIALDDHTTGE